MANAFVPNRHVQRIKTALDHPIIDSDAHLIEYLPDVRDRLLEIGGPEVAKRFDRHYWTMDHGQRAPLAVRRRYGISRPSWWTYAAKNSLDRATAMLPQLLYERLDEVGIDFAVVYPSYFIQFPTADNEDFRRAGCRAVNQYLADAFDGLQDRLFPVAAIPMHTPEEALDGLRHAVALGFRAVVLPGLVLRTLPGSGRVWVDTLGIDSEYDYDPVWEFCQQSGLAATFHSSGMGWGARDSLVNFMHNHLGHFAAAGDATARSLLFAGVPIRFPRLRFAFLEGGAAWGASLYAQLRSHYSKRNRRAILHYDPRQIDFATVSKLFDDFATPRVRARSEQLEHALLPFSTPLEPVPDEFSDTGFESTDDITRVFSRSFFFGCEGDDPMSVVASTAFSRHLGTEINAIYGSDIGHWDVRDIRDVLHEVHELVDTQLFSKEDFRRLVFEAPIRLWTDNNPDFFKGTRVEAEVAHYRAASP